MKLHLPGGLRAALMACFAVVSGIASTLSTATITGGVFAVTIAAQVQAADFVYTETQTISSLTLEEGSNTIDVATGVTVTSEKLDASKNNLCTYTKTGGGVFIAAGAPTTARPVSAVIEGGTLVIGYAAGWGGGFVNETATVNSGAILKLDVENALGGDTSGTRGCTEIILNGLEGEGNQATLNAAQNTRLYYGLTLNGYALVKGAGVITAYGKDVVISATGGENVVSNAVSITETLTLDVAKDGSLQFSGALTTEQGGSLTKTGEGLVTVNGGSINGALTLETGVLRNAGEMTVDSLKLVAGTSFINGGEDNSTASLTLNGELYIDSAIQNYGTITLGENVSLAFSINQATLLPEEGDTIAVSVKIFEGNGTINNAHYLTAGYTDATLENGVLTFKTRVLEFEGSEDVSSPEPLVWGIKSGDSFSSNGTAVAYQDGDCVTFLGNTTAELVEDVRPMYVTVKENAHLSLDGAHKLSVSRFILDGTFSYTVGGGSPVIDVETWEIGNNAAIGLYLGDGTTSYSLSSVLPEDYRGNVIIHSGQGLLPTPFTGSNFDPWTGNCFSTTIFKSLTVEEGAQLELGASYWGGFQHSLWMNYEGNVTIEGKGANGASGAFVMGYRTKWFGDITVGEKGATIQLQHGGPSEIVGNLLLKGKLTYDGSAQQVGGSGYLRLMEDTSFLGGGGLDIVGGTLQIGGWSGSNGALETGDISLASGATLCLQHASGIFLAADSYEEYLAGKTRKANLSMNGAELKVQDIGWGNNTCQFGTLSLSGDNELSYVETGRLLFEELTSKDESKLNITVGEVGPERVRAVEFATIKDFNGSISQTCAGSSKLDLVIGTVDQSVGKDALITGPVLSRNFAKTGEGSLMLESLTVNGKLQMNYQGTLNGCQIILEDGKQTVNPVDFSSVLTLGEDCVLVYNKVPVSGQLIELTSAHFAQGQKAIIDVSALTLSELRTGILTGFVISEDFDLINNAANYFSNSLMGLEFVKAQDGDTMFTLKLADTARSDVSWDERWGITETPYHVPEVTVEGTLEEPLSLLGSFEYELTDSTVAEITSAPESGLVVYGGSAKGDTASLAGGSWIKVSGGAIDLVVGGSSRGDFTGDAHIYLTGTASANDVVGGNSHYSDKMFTGDTYVSVDTTGIGGSVVGGSILQGGDYWVNDVALKQKGDTHVYVYQALSSNSGIAWAESRGKVCPDAVIGGHAALGGASSNLTLDGSTSVTVDLSGLGEAQAEFNKRLIGGSFLWTNGSAGTYNSYVVHTGDTSVAVDADNAVVFSGVVVGDSYLSPGRQNGAYDVSDWYGIANSTLGGNSSVTINGGTYDAAVVGGTYVSGVALMGDAGIYENQPRPGDSHAVIEGSTNVVLTGGVYRENVVGGSAIAAGYIETVGDYISASVTVNGGTNLTISGGEYQGAIVSGSLVNSFKGTGSIGGQGTCAELSGDVSVKGILLGGNYITQGSGVIEGGTHITIMGGEYAGAIVGGSYTENTIISNQQLRQESIIEGGTHIAIGGNASLNNNLIGGDYLRYGSASIKGGTAVSVSSSSVGGKGWNIVGGSYVEDPSPLVGYGYNDVIATIEGGTRVVLERVLGASSEVAANIIGAFYVDESYRIDGAVYTVDSTSVELNGGRITGSVVTGGSFIDDVLGHAYGKMNLGDLSLTLDGATVETNLYGGSYCMRNHESSSITQNSATLSLRSGTLAADAYAAGCQIGNSSISTVNTVVELSNEVELKGDRTIYGGYGTSSTNAVVTGSKTISFISSDDYYNIGTTLFRDFDTVSVAKDASIELLGTHGENKQTLEMLLGADGGTLTKTGEGTFIMGENMKGASVLVKGGTLKMNTNLTSISVADGGVLDATSADTAAGVLTLDGLASMKLDGTRGLTLGAGVAEPATSLLTVKAGAKMNLLLDETSLAGERIVLFTGLSEAAIQGILFSRTDDANGTVYAELSDYVFNAADIMGGRGILVLEDGGSLVILNQNVAGVYWKWINKSDTGIWDTADESDENWNRPADSSADGRLTVFGDDGMGDDKSTTVIIAGPVTPSSVLVNATTGDYLFVDDGETTTSGISGTASLSMEGTGKLTLALENSATGDLTVRAGEVVFGTDVAASWGGAIKLTGDGKLHLVNVAGNEVITGITATENATVTVESGITLASLEGGKLIANTTGGEVNIKDGNGSGADITSFTSVENAGTGQLNFHTQVAMGALVNKGDIVIGSADGSTLYDITIDGAVTGNGGLSAATVTLNGDSSFASLTADMGLVTAGNTVTLAADSSLASISEKEDATQKTALVVSGGVTTVSSADGVTLRSLEVADKAQLYVVNGPVTIEGELVGAGSLKSGGDVTFSKGGTLSGGLELTGSNGKLVLGNTLNVGAVTGVSEIDIAGKFLGPLADYGNPAGTDKTALLMDVSSLDSNSLTISFGELASLVDINLQAGGSKESYTLISSDTEMTGLAPERMTLLVNTTEGEHLGNSYVYHGMTYELTLTDGGFSVSLRKFFNGYVWEGDDSDSVWSAESGSDDWSRSGTPGESDNVAFMGGGIGTGGVGTVLVDGGAAPVHVAGITVDTASADVTAGQNTSYIFTGANGDAKKDIVLADTLFLTVGSVTLDKVSLGSASDALDSALIGAAGSMTVGTGSSFYTDSLTVNDSADSSLNFSNAGTTVVGGAFTVGDMNEVFSNSGSLSLGDGSSLGKVDNSGVVTATGGRVTIAELVTGGDLTAGGSSTFTVQNLSAGAMGTASIKSGSTLEIKSSPTSAAQPLWVQSLVGATGSTFKAVGQHVMLGQSTTNGGKVQVMSLNLSQASHSTLQSLETESLTLNVSGLVTQPKVALLTLTEAPASAGTIELTLTGFSKSLLKAPTQTVDAKTLTYNNDTLGTYHTETLADGYVSEWTDYTLVDAVAGYSWNLSEEQRADIQQMFALENAFAKLWVNEGDVVLSVYKDKPREWNSSNDGWAGNKHNSDPSNGIKPGEVLDLTEIAGIYKDFDSVDKVIIDQTKTLNLTDAVAGDNLDDATDTSRGVVLRNLEGDCAFTIVGDSATDGAFRKDLVTLSNSEDSELKAAFAANKVALQVEATTAGAALKAGDVTLDAAVLDLKGGVVSANPAEALSTYGADFTAGDMMLSNGSALTVEAGDMGASLTAGVVTLGKDSSFSVKPAADSTQQAGSATIAGLSSSTVGSGFFSGAVTVVGTKGNYSGSYSAAHVTLADKAAQTLTASKELSLDSAADVQSASVTLSYKGGNAEMGKVNLSNTSITLENISDANTTNTLNINDSFTMDKGVLTFSVSAQEVADAISGVGAAVVVTEGNPLTLKNTTVQVLWDSSSGGRVSFDAGRVSGKLTLFTLSEGASFTDISFLYGGDTYFSRYFRNMEWEGGKLVAEFVSDFYTSLYGMTENGTAGLQMLDAADLELAPQGNVKDYKDLAGVMDALQGFKASEAAAADKLAAAVAGSGVASLGMALSGDVERQLKAIRNRTTTMGVDPSVVNEDMPYFNAWINAEGDYRSMDDGGTLAGYTVNSYGGTVGFDMDVTPELTWGLALTAMYGDFESTTVDKVDGDMDTYYVSAFARATHGAWTHTFVATVGMSRSELSRTVSHKYGSYTAEGEADGMSFGFLYEAARTYALNEDASTCWQPVFNVSFRHISVDGYEEDGSDAALKVGDQSLNTVTFGLGGRLQSIVGENVYNRTSVFEARALVKFDAGDRESEVENALINAPSTTATVKSAELDAIGLEVGAGLTVPVGFDGGSIFVDGSLEFRGSYTNFNAAAGYRVNF